MDPTPLPSPSPSLPLPQPQSPSPSQLPQSPPSKAASSNAGAKEAKQFNVTVDILAVNTLVEVMVRTPNGLLLMGRVVGVAWGYEGHPDQLSALVDTKAGLRLVVPATPTHLALLV